ncbi:glutathione S-transferase [Aureimonas sp. SA4125]|uniref:glutathione S-transferase family protein n=1 Tax=Aureimonas sp. SA4125 TaxID=2826993 RepID=UPI001CC504F1|nr:glutathione S-transferase family protein [Aureimonas sp. SA4125]BDA84755.1 glutathione S-transferase [Aureimonas sp. SA4125]
MYALTIANKNYSSWSLRPWVLMRTLGIDFEERMRPFADGPDAPPRDFSPTGKVPCLEDAGLVVWDSLAIIEYLAERHDGVWPSSATARAFARCAAAEMHSGFQALRNECSMSVGQTVALSQRSPALSADLRRIASLWNEGLTRFGGPFLAGQDFCAVDAFFAPVAFRIRTFGLELDGPAADYATRLLALPAMQEWEKAALAETWRDSSHEAEVLAAGTVLEDRRAVA